MAGDFLRVQCPDCENEQTLFGKAASEVVCAVCGTTLSRSTFFNFVIEGDFIDVFESR